MSVSESVTQLSEPELVLELVQKMRAGEMPARQALVDHLRPWVNEMVQQFLEAWMEDIGGLGVWLERALDRTPEHGQEQPGDLLADLTLYASRVVSRYLAAYKPGQGTTLTTFLAPYVQAELEKYRQAREKGAGPGLPEEIGYGISWSQGGGKGFVVYRGNAPITTPEERRRLEDERDRDRLTALHASTVAQIEAPKTREHLIEIAHKNGALAVTAYVLQEQSKGTDRPLSDDEALDRAKNAIAEFGDTTGHRRGEPHYPHAFVAPRADEYDQAKRIVWGKHPRGKRNGPKLASDGLVRSGKRKKNGQDLTLTFVRMPAPKYLRTPARIRIEEKQLREAKAEAVAKRLQERERQRAQEQTEDTRASARQREAHILVRVQGLSLAKAGEQMVPPIKKQNVARLLAKFDRAQDKAHENRSAILSDCPQPRHNV
jgi:hypothetical protein